MYADNDTTNWDNVSIAEKARIGYSFNGADGTFFMTKEQFNLNFASVSWSPKLEGWTRSYFLKVDDTFVNPGKNVYGGSKYTRHDSKSSQTLIRVLSSQSTLMPSDPTPGILA